MSFILFIDTAKLNGGSGSGDSKGGTSATANSSCEKNSTSCVGGEGVQKVAKNARISILVRSRGGLSGHAWIRLEIDGEEATTFGTFGNNPLNKGNGLHEGLEISLNSDVSRSAQIDSNSLEKLQVYIEGVRAQGENGWTYERNCSVFATEAWKAATGEHLDAINNWNVSTPSKLESSIFGANGWRKK